MAAALAGFAALVAFVVLGAALGLLVSVAAAVAAEAEASPSPALEEAVLVSPGSWPIWMILPDLYSKPYGLRRPFRLRRLQNGNAWSVFVGSGCSWCQMRVEEVVTVEY